MLPSLAPPLAPTPLAAPTPAPVWDQPAIDAVFRAAAEGDWVSVMDALARGFPAHTCMGGMSGRSPTLLHIAVGRCDLPVMKQLLSAGVDPDVRNAEGLPPLADANMPEAMQLLIDSGADVNLSFPSYPGCLLLCCLQRSLRDIPGHCELVNDMLADRRRVQRAAVMLEQPALELEQVQYALASEVHSASCSRPGPLPLRPKWSPVELLKEVRLNQLH